MLRILFVREMNTTYYYKTYKHGIVFCTFENIRIASAFTRIHTYEYVLEICTRADHAVYTTGLPFL